MSTWRMEVKEGEEVEDVEDEESAAAESRLARNVANFGMAARRYYTPGRIRSEEKRESGWMAVGASIHGFRA
jgi:dihydroxyacetone kinase